jgi:AhpD family alkylhydroperoxidase
MIEETRDEQRDDITFLRTEWIKRRALMDNQIEYYTETGKYRDRFDEALPKLMPAYSTFRKEVYKDGALSAKTKRLIALAAGLQAGCTRCVQGQTKDAVAAGATKAEILEAVAVAVVMGGTAVSAETWRVVKVLEELGKW